MPGSLERPGQEADSGPVTPITFAHRGARADLPENTLPAFARALERGARGLETDAHRSGDGEAVLVHDAAFRRGLRRVRVAATPSADLAQLDVPRLTDLYRECGTEYELSIDLKTEGVEEPILAAATVVDAVERLWLCSGNVVPPTRDPRSGRPAGEARALDPGASVSGPVERYAANLAEAGLDVVQPPPRGMDRGPGRAVPPVRRACVRVGRARGATSSRRVSRWGWTRSTPTTSIAWSRPSRNSPTVARADPLQETEAVEGPDAHEDAARRCSTP